MHQNSQVALQHRNSQVAWNSRYCKLHIGNFLETVIFYGFISFSASSLQKQKVSEGINHYTARHIARCRAPNERTKPVWCVAHAWAGSRHHLAETATAARQTGQAGDLASHRSTQAAWNACRQAGIARHRSPARGASRHTAQGEGVPPPSRGGEGKAKVGRRRRSSGESPARSGDGGGAGPRDGTR